MDMLQDDLEILLDIKMQLNVIDHKLDHLISTSSIMQSRGTNPTTAEQHGTKKPTTARL